MGAAETIQNEQKRSLETLWISDENGSTFLVWGRLMGYGD